VPTQRWHKPVLFPGAKRDPERMGLTAALKGSQADLADTGPGTAVLN
jgi:hypothetical protein